MVTAITKYASRDGSEWVTSEQAEHRDALCEAIAGIMAPLGEYRSLRSNEYRRHDPRVVIRTRVALLALCAKTYPTESAFRHEPPEEVAPLGFVGRLLSNMGGPLNKAWWRFCVIDDTGREWEQPYFVLNPDKRPHDAHAV